MDKEALLKLKEEIANLSKEESKERDNHLRALACGEVAGPPTGYASIDKPELRYHREEPIKKIKSEQTLYDMVFDQNDMNTLAIEYLGTNWTFKKLKRKVDQCAKAFVKYGIKNGDKVLIGMSNTPETYIILLALNKIGAVSKWFDIRASAKDIEEYANSSKCVCMIAFDMLIPLISEVVDQTGLRNIIITGPANPVLPTKVKLLIGLLDQVSHSKVLSLKKWAQGFKKRFIDQNEIPEIRSLPKDKRFISFDTFMNKGIGFDNVESVPFDEDRIAVTIQSSGTTGKAKTIVHKDQTYVNSTISSSYSDLPLDKHKTSLVVLPPWIAYAQSNAIITPMTLGSKVILSPDFEPDAAFRYIGKYEILYAVPFHLRYIRDHYNELSDQKKMSLKNVECIITGGDKITAEELRDMEELFGTTIINGYGNNEGFGALSYTSFKKNCHGSVGHAKYGDSIIIYDSENHTELPYGQVGEVCTLSKTSFVEYENNKDATSETKLIHEDGNIYIHTGDLGYMNSDGNIFLGGRARRVIIRQAFKISAYTIEDGITSLPFVKECVTVSVNDEVEEHVPMSYVVVDEMFSKKNEKDLEDMIKEHCKRSLKINEIPKYIRIVESLPYTPNGKYDFLALEKDGNEYVEANKVSRVLNFKKNF